MRNLNMAFRRWALALFGLGAVASPALALEKVKFTLASTIDSRSGPLFLAIDRGYFAQEGLELEVVPGAGSADTVNRIASGIFAIGIGDVASLIKFNATNPDRKVKTVYNFYMADLALVTMKGRGIAKPADLKGKIIGAPTGDTAYRMFPAFTAATGITANDVKWEHMAMPIREAMLLQGKVDAVTATAISAKFSLKSAGAKEEDIIFIRYRDVGVNIVGNGLITSQAMIEQKPELVARIVKALNHGWMDTLSNVEASADAAIKREPLLDRNNELGKLRDTILNFTGSPDAKKTGVGSYSDETLKYSIDIISRAENMQAKVEPSDIADMKFLPPVGERMAP